MKLPSKLRILLLAGAALALAAPAFAAPAHVQSFPVTTSGTATSGTTLNFTLPAAIGNGDTFVGEVFEESSSNVITSITDDKSNTYTLLDNTALSNHSGNFVQSFALANITNGPKTFTVHFSSTPTGATQYLWGDEYSGVQSIDAHKMTYTTAATTFPSGSVTLTGTNDLIYLGGSVWSGGLTAPTGYTLRVNDTSEALFSSDFAFTGTGSYGGASYTSGSTEDVMVAIVGLVPTPVVATPKSITFNPTYGIVVDTAASGTVVGAFTVPMSDGSTYSGTNTLLHGSDPLCAVPATGNGNITLATGPLTSANAASQHVCKLEATQNSVTTAEFDFLFNIEKAVEFSDTTTILPGLTNGYALGVANGAFAMIAPQAGPPGTAATVNVGTVATGAPGTSATVTNSGNTSAAVLNFTIPAGTPGQNGTNGTNGANAGQVGLFTPTSSTMACSQGQSGFDATYLYLCVATNSWGRLNLTVSGSTLQTSGW